jgi:predicted amidohydrolase
MPHTISLAAIQLDARPAPVIERLKRAEALVMQAVAVGAQIILLPEVFNTGYEYSDQNYACTEPLNGPTVTWLLHTAAHAGVHLAGILFLRSQTTLPTPCCSWHPMGKSGVMINVIRGHGKGTTF